jgi:tripartite-type tricarboxylate transporter receptor subunit TctC
MKRLATLATGAAMLAAATLACAQDYPTKPIRIVVPYAPGGPADLVSRMIGSRLNEAWKQPVIVDNRPGGNTITGAEVAAKAAPDGYTLFVPFVGTLAINPSMYPKLPYDPLKDYAPITLIATLPLILVVTPSLPANSVKELIALAKTQPGKLSFGSSGVGQASHLGAELFKSMAGTDMTHVPYRGNALAVADVVGGQISLIFDGMTSSLPLVRSGKLKALAISTAKRSLAVPDLITVAEAGVPGYDVGSWVGILTSAGTPRAIVDKLNREIVAYLEMPATRERLLQMGLELQTSTPQGFHDYIRSEIAKWSKVVKESGAKAE